MPRVSLRFLNTELSDTQVQEYFRIVNQSIRKVYRELALRESGDRKQNDVRSVRGGGGWLE